MTSTAPVPLQLSLAVQVLRAGGTVLHATEGVWGLACDPFDPAAIDGLLRLKGRPVNKGLILIGASADMFAVELADLDPPQRRAVTGSWPGPVTWTLRSHRFPAWISGGRPTIAARVPGHAQARALCAAFGGALVSASANVGGRPPARNQLRARALLRDWHCGPGARPLLYLLPGETGGRRGPSEIRTTDGLLLRAPDAATPRGAGS